MGIAAVNAQEAVDPEIAAARHHEKRLENCPKDEVRCVWLRDSARWVRVLSVNLEKQKPLSYLEIHNWSMRASQERVYQAGEIEEMRSLLKKLPKSTKDAGQLETFAIAFWDGNAVSVRRYSLDSMPASVEDFLKKVAQGSVEKKPFNDLDLVDPREEHGAR